MRRALRFLTVLAVVLAVAVPTAWTLFLQSERYLVIGAHDAIVRPVTDGHATLDFGALLPQVRVPIDVPGNIGVAIDLGDSQGAGLEEMLARDAVIASQPEGEISAISSAIIGMAVSAALRGLGLGLLAGLLTVLIWTGLGAARRRELRSRLVHPDRSQVLLGSVTALVVVGSLVLVAVPGGDGRPTKEWVPLTQEFPELPADSAELRTIELAQGSATSSSRALVEGALYLYRDSVTFYEALDVNAEQAVLRTPGEGETTALVVTDRHDNIGMDPVVRTIADRAQARMLVDLGDDTGQGASWESFSINSLSREFDGFETVAVAGNHDTDAVAEQMADQGFTVLDGEPVEVGGVRFLGASDPRGTTLTGYTEDATTRSGGLADQDVALRDTACAADGAGERVAVLAVHSWASASEVAASGCVDLVLTGHLHYQVGPTAIDGPGETTTTRLTTGTTGGAVLPIALGSSLRRQAQVSVVTFDAEGVPVGLQVVSFNPSKVIEVADYVELPLPSQGAGPAAPDPVEDPSAEATATPEVLPSVPAQQ
ncbi:MAG: metallophosphoesterase [Aeromicrobium sp.]